MTEKEVSRLFDELSELAQALNDESDTVTKMIHQFEERLNGFRLGVEAWVQVNSDTQDFRWHDPDLRDDDEDPGEPAVRSTDVELGFARHGTEWRLVIRSMQYQNINERGWEETRKGEAVALLEASRVDRIHALEKFQALQEALKANVAALLAKVKAAKAVMK